jgi:elongation factor G
MERKSEQLRNIALIAHVGSGKTSLAEAMLFNGKGTSRLGRVDDGTSNFDFEPEELKRRITISTSIHHCDWKKHIINIIDTPETTTSSPTPRRVSRRRRGGRS